MKKLKYILLFILPIILYSCSDDSDNTCPALIDGIIQNVELDKLPKLINDNGDGIAGHIGNINYPAEARDQGIEGEVKIEYAISTEGKIEDVLIKEDIGGGCGEAAKNAVQILEGQILYYPAEYQGNPVKVYKLIPIKFKLE